MSRSTVHQNPGTTLHPKGAFRSLATTQFSWLFLLFASGSIILMTNSVVAELDDDTSQINLNSDLKYNYLSQALERLHFGPLMRLRSINSINFHKQQFDSDLPKSKEKKALSYLSRFYPMFQPNIGSRSRPMSSKNIVSLNSSRRRISFPRSSETVSFPVGRFTRPIMRLRWGK